MRIVCISDTHGDHQQVKLPAGDVLLHAGDTTAHGSEQDYVKFLEWFAAQPFETRIFIAGNHDQFPDQQPELAARWASEAGVTYLCDSGIEVGGVNIWGSPITLQFANWYFMREPGADIQRHWNLIPESTDVLVTHGPPFGILDTVVRSDTFAENTGCPDLLNRIREIRPSYHVFGHIHECYGQLESAGTRFLNVATMDNHYQIANAPVVIDW